jgi:c-di-GMP-binding flagellar brake protein YcgR
MEESKPQFGIVNFERRRNTRFSVDLPIEYSRVDTAAKHTGRAGNASEGGLMFYLPQRVEVGQHLRAKLFFASEPGLHSIEVLAEVVWMEFPFDSEGDYRCGVKFVDIAPEDLNRLKDFLENLAKIKVPRRVSP